jgi:hypothetical protein
MIVSRKVAKEQRSKEKKKGVQINKVMNFTLILNQGALLNSYTPILIIVLLTIPVN